MPKETFFNLPEEKRANITNIAIEEFADNNYDNVSISRIVARAGIAKGSFYQYFEDKEDLYGYLLEMAMQKKWEVLSLDHPDPQHIGVFRYLLWTAKTSLQLQILYPKLVKIAYRALHSNAYPPEFWARAQQESNKFFLHLVAIGKEQGDIALEVDNDLAAFIFSTVVANLGQYMLPHIADFDAAQPEASAFFSPKVTQIFEQTLAILEHGMGRAQPSAISEQPLNMQEVQA